MPKNEKKELILNYFSNKHPKSFEGKGELKLLTLWSFKFFEYS
jgi:hypothetical protein